jgi:hypothetical protein
MTRNSVQTESTRRCEDMQLTQERWAAYHVDGFANDVFISYTHEDDCEEAGLRWVSRFEVELRNRLAKVSGQSVQGGSARRY